MKKLFAEKIDYVQLALNKGYTVAMNQLEIDILDRVRFFHLRAAAKRIKLDAANLLRKSRKHKIKFNKYLTKKDINGKLASLRKESQTQHKKLK